MWVRKLDIISNSETWCKIGTVIVVSTWALGPPLWFFIENFLLISEEDKEKKLRRMARFKLGREIARDFWIAVGALILALFVEK